jgi:hypothetical protein
VFAVPRSIAISADNKPNILPNIDRGPTLRGIRRLRCPLS